MASFTTKNNASEKPIEHERLKPASRRHKPTPEQTRKVHSAAALPALAVAQWVAALAGAAETRRLRIGAKYPPPGDIPAGNDDDVVARQLREAAMREADPEVREKLWNEYRKYKGIEVPAS